MKRLKKYFLWVFTYLIPRYTILPDLSFVSVFRFLKNGGKPVRKNTVLIFEPNWSHGECIPGYAKYFLDLGFNVDVLMHRSSEVKYPCCRISSEKLSIIGHSIPIMRRWLTKERLCHYKAVFINSSVCRWGGGRGNNGKPVPSTVDYFQLQDVKNLLVVEHNLRDVERFHEEAYIKAGQLLTLGKFSVGKMVNPHYFGEVHQLAKNTDKTRFIVVGNIMPNSRNLSLIFSAIERLMARGIENFEVVMIGGGRSKNIPEAVRPFVTCKGRLDFPEMYNEMEKCDFYLPAFDPDNKSHLRYINTSVSGSIQLIYGFLKPCLVHEKFATFNGFNQDNSIIYNRNEDLAEAMKRAIETTPQQYDELRMKLKPVVESVYGESMKNIREALGRFETESFRQTENSKADAIINN